uniref:ABC transmembrane type-1 domain-containing protein n=1 Tax=Pseudo-nitzschia australis TaxID=44445 RepID=A0A6V0BZX5_9STRA|mmetsp:Transcript_24870/g.52787  ORF Transcript_24870/g.52787 Transcript_24870/m.52787 type:complete len:382 (-) Transcript_24870:155-1300(-)
MTRRRLFFFFSVVVSAQLILLAEKCNCYLIDLRINTSNRIRQQTHRCSSSSDKNGENAIPKRKSRPPSLRCPDYPYFAYDDNKRISFDSELREEMYGDDQTSEVLFGMLTPPSAALEYDFLVSGIRNSNRRTRLLNRRFYTAREPFLQKNINEPPCLQDLKAPPSPVADVIWISIPFRILSLFVPYYSFPYLIGFLDNYVTMKPEQLSGITDKFGPGVSILYGTFISLTLAILYERQRDIQNEVAVEASLLALITRNLLNILRCDKALSIEAGQSSADQIRILAKGSRGSELLAIMYSDPYARMLEIIEEREYMLMERRSGDLGGEGVAIASCRQILEDLFKIRADRLSDESLALPPTHFLIMTILTLFILLGYAIVSCGR